MLITIVTFFIILGVLILAHELGHFLTARMFKVRAEEFGFGYPPRIFGIVKSNITKKWKRVGAKEDAAKYKNMVWSLNWLLLGGFVKIKGEDGEGKDEQDSFGSKSVWQRFVMLFAGVFMNFVLCFALLTFGLMVGMPTMTMVDDQPDAGLRFRQEQVQIMSVVENSPAKAAGINVGDGILQIDGQVITGVKQVQEAIGQSAGLEMEFILLQSGEEKKINIVADFSRPGADKPEIGVSLVKTAIVSYPWYMAIYKGAENTVILTAAIIKAFAGIISNLARGQGVGVDVAGPVGIAFMTGRVVKMGWMYVLQFAALLSVNLAIVNLLPIPALDGGRILFLIIEKIKGGPVRQKVEASIHQVGFLLIIILMIMVIFMDMRHYGCPLWLWLKGMF